MARGDNTIKVGYNRVVKWKEWDEKKGRHVDKQKEVKVYRKVKYRKVR